MKETLIMRNNPDGLIWQIYHVMNQVEKEILTQNANNNGFTVECAVYQDGIYEETSPNWRETEEWRRQLRERGR